MLSAVRRGFKVRISIFSFAQVAERNNIPIFTLDKDFEIYSAHVEIRLYIPDIPEKS